MGRLGAGPGATKKNGRPPVRWPVILVAPLAALSLLLAAAAAPLAPSPIRARRRTPQTDRPRPRRPAGPAAAPPQQSAARFCCLCPLARRDELPRLSRTGIVKGGHALGTSWPRPELAAVPVRLAGVPKLAAAGAEHWEQLVVQRSGRPEVLAVHALARRDELPRAEQSGPVHWWRRDQPELAHVRVGQRGLPALPPGWRHWGLNRAPRPGVGRKVVPATRDGTALGASEPMT